MGLEQLDRAICERESAHHMLNEQINANLQFRAELILQARRIESLNAEIEKLKAELAAKEDERKQRDCDHKHELDVLREALTLDVSNLPAHNMLDGA